MALLQQIQTVNQVTGTRTIVTVPAATDTPLVAANPNRKYLAFANSGTGLANLSLDAVAATVQGWPMAAAPATNDQGGQMVFEAGGILTNAFRVYSTLGTTIIVFEGI